MGRVTKVLDRNGEVVPFRRSRVVRAILAAVRSAGSGEEWVADKLADMVVYFLDSVHGDRPVPPSAEDVDDMIEKALLSTPDLGVVSQAFLAARRQRTELREIEQAAQPDTPGPEVAQSAQHLRGWNRARITAALVREQNIEAARAAEVALAVEQRVIALNLPRLSTGLIRELVDVELLARGLASQPGMLSVPRYDIEQWLLGSDEHDAQLASSQRELGERAGRRILSEYSLSSVLPEAARELHLAGRVLFEHIDAPAAVAALRLDAPACLEPGAGFGMARIYPEAAQSPAAAFARLAALVRDAGEFTAGSITLRGLDLALLGEDADRTALQEGLRLLAWQAPNQLRIEVGPSSGPERDLVIRALIDAVAGADSSLRQRVSLELAVSPGAFADPARRALLERAVAAACHCGEPAFRLREAGAPQGAGLFGEAGAPRHAATLARACINLVAPALEASDLSSYLAALEPQVDGAVAGLAARLRLLDRVAMRDLPEPATNPPRMMRAVVGVTRDVEVIPAGLATAAAMLGGDDAGAQRAAQQILGFLSLRLRESAGRLNLRATLGAPEGPSLARMAAADMRAVTERNPDSPVRLKLAAEDAYANGAALQLSLPLAQRLGRESALHLALGRDATSTAGPDEHLPAAEVMTLLRNALAEGNPRPTRLRLAVRHRACRDCGSVYVATAEACPACGSTAWAAAQGQKLLFE